MELIEFPQRDEARQNHEPAIRNDEMTVGPAENVTWGQNGGMASSQDEEMTVPRTEEMTPSEAPENPILLRKTEDLSPPSFHGLVGRHPSILSVVEVIRRVAPTDATVLISGESGTGKELVAEAIHRMSTRSRGRFVPVHCGAIPEDLLESEMFGHEKGAFTGAIASRIGRFGLANGGTIFLDEIGEMSPKLQVKLLRVLEDGRVEPVGSVATQHVDVRIIAATNRNLQDSVATRTFREDLYYRLRVVPIEMPPLRRRRDDVPLLVHHFLRELHTQKGLRPCVVSDEAMDGLVQYGWPGNVRELKNILEQMLVLGEGDGVLRTADLPAHITAAQAPDASPAQTAPWEFGSRGIDFYREMEVIEDRIIAQALRLSAGNKKEAARLLRVNRTTLLEKLKRKRQQDGLLGRLLNEGVAWSTVAPLGEGNGIACDLRPNAGGLLA
jgi:transcriptional regulator with PAS, ATPase and Fis domain